MSLRLQLLQVARLAPRLLGDSSELVRQFFRSQISPAGAGLDRSGRPDLYYTVFALAGLHALDGEAPYGSVENYLRSHGDGSTLDFVHLCALARCWAIVGFKDMPSGFSENFLQRIESFRKADRGYGDASSQHGTAYGAMLAVGAYQDLGHSAFDFCSVIQSLQPLETTDGGWSNFPGARIGATNATAGAIILLKHFGQSVDERAVDWLLAQRHEDGGFIAVPGAPMPDLLSTATALHALAAMDRQLPAEQREQCLDFLDSLWDARGGFYGHWADEFVDVEYAFYALLALGHLSCCKY